MGFWFFCAVSRPASASAPPPPPALPLPTTLSHTLFHTQLGHTPSFTHNLVTHHVSPNFVTHTHTRTPCFTYNFVTHHLSHTTLSHTIFHNLVTHHLSHTFTHSFVTRYLSHTFHIPSFCLAGVALGDIDLSFAWQAWHLATSAFVSRGRRGAYMALGVPWSCGDAAALRGRRGTWHHGHSICVTGVALGDIYICLAGLALGEIDFRFAWQAWHLAAWTFHLQGVALA